MVAITRIKIKKSNDFGDVATLNPIAFIMKIKV